MGLFQFFALCLFVGLAIWAIGFTPIAPQIKTLILVAGIIVLVVVFLNALGIFDSNIAIPKLGK